MPTYLDSFIYETYLNNVWVDISPYVIEDVTGEWGIYGNTPVDRVAGTGEMRIVLENSTGLFTPGLNQTLSGWKKGVPFRVTCVFEGKPTVKFYGTVRKIDFDSGILNAGNAYVTILDWMNTAAEHPILLSSILTDKRIDEAVTNIVNNMPIQPLNRQFALGIDTFPSVFDNTKPSTKALTEFNKLGLSELGYIYLKKDAQYGETLVVESRNSRGISSEPSPLPKSRGTSSRLMTEDGKYIVTENREKIILDELLEKTAYINNMIDVDVDYGEDVINFVSSKIYPRNKSTTLETLFSLNSPIRLLAGEKKENIKITYKDPTGGNVRINADPLTMVTPVATTHYLMWSNQNGSGTNLTANLVLSVTFGSEGAIYSIENVGATTGYVTKVIFQGYPIYMFDPIEYLVEDADSINEHGYKQMTIEQKYQTSPSLSATYANTILSQSKTAKKILRRVDFIANTSDDLMMAFLYHDIGSLIYIKHDKTGIDGFYYIDAVQFKFKQGGAIYFSWKVRYATTLEEIYWLVGVDGYSELGETTIIGY